MKLKNRLVVNISVVALLSVVVWQAAYIDIQRINEKFDHILGTSSQEVLALENLSTHVFRMQLEVTNYIVLNAVSSSDEVDKASSQEDGLATAEKTEFLEAQTQAEYWIAVFQKHYQRYFDEGGIREKNGEEDSKVLELNAIFDSYKRKSQAVFELEKEDLTANVVREKMGELEGVEDEFVENINKIMANEVAELKMEGESAQAIVAESRLLLGSICGAVLLVSIFLGWAIAVSIARPIEKLKIAAAAVGKGEYSTKVDIVRDDEIGQLATAFNQMVDDLAHSKILEAQKLELEELNGTLKKKNDALDSFVYRVSHDLKAPIVNISSLLGLMKGKIAPEDNFSKKTVGFMEGSIHQLQTTIYDLLEVSRIELKLKLQADNLSFERMFKELESTIQEQIRQADAHIETDFSLAPTLSFAKANLQSILSNLLTNALKYRSPERQCHIVVKSFMQKGKLLLSIQDNGIGMDLKRQGSKLFQMFSRLHDHVEGTGVGLYIVKKLVEESGGKITVESQLGIGTCFTIQFPSKNKVTHAIAQNDLAGG